MARNQVTCYNHPSLSSREHLVRTEWQVRTVLGDCTYPRQKWHQFERHSIGKTRSLISDFLDFSNLSIREEAALARNRIKDRPEGLKLQNLTLANWISPAVRSQLKIITADVLHAINSCESLGSGKQLILHGNSSAIAKEFSPHMAVLRCHFLQKTYFQCCVLLQGTLGGNFDIFAASGESTAWVFLQKTRSRTIGVRVCPISQFNYVGTSFDPRAWTIVVFWREKCGCQPQLITFENEGGDETNYPSPPNFTFFDDPGIPFSPQGQTPPAPPGLPGPPAPPGLPPGWPPVPSPAVTERG